MSDGVKLIRLISGPVPVVWGKCPQPRKKDRGFCVQTVLGHTVLKGIFHSLIIF